MCGFDVCMYVMYAFCVWRVAACGCVVLWLCQSGFHLLAGETRHLSFSSWREFGELNSEVFAKSLSVQWLNYGRSME